MITVSKEKLDNVEYLLTQSAQGNHILFDHHMVRSVFTLPAKPMSEAEAYEVEHHIEKMISLDSIPQQKAYVDQLPSDILHRVIKTYFNIVENNLFEATPLRH